MKYAYLVNVDVLSNHNKFYEITENDDKSIDVRYGRVGDIERTHHYSPNEKQFFTLKQSKIDRGYIDETALHAERTVSSKGYEELSYEPIPDEKIQELVDMLIKSSNDFMRTNYTITAKEITDKMITEAENDLESLIEIADNQGEVWKFNEVLMELYSDVPRKMDNVEDFIAKSKDDYSIIVEREQDMLTNLKGQLQPEEEHKNIQKSGTVLDAYGLSIREATYKQEDEIIAHLGRDYDGKSCERRFVRALCVENERTRNAYEQFKDEHHLQPKDCRLFYHGSKTENWFSIMKQGMLLNPDAKVTGKMFGSGIYFAPDCRKALNYMDTKGSHWNNGNRQTGFTAVYAVALGKCYSPNTALHSYFTKKDLPDGCLSVYANKKKVGLYNDEYVVYDQSQCTIKYLLEMTNPYVRELEFTIDRKDIRNRLNDSLHTLTKIPDGVRAEVDIDTLPEPAYKIINERLIVPHDVDKLYIDYNSRSDRINFSCVDIYGESKTIYADFTRDDLSFLMREMKKSFAESEKEWKEIVSLSENEKTGTLVYDKSNPVKRREDLSLSKKPIETQQALEKC